MQIRKNGKFIVELDAREIIALLTELEDSSLPYSIIKNILSKLEQAVDKDTNNALNQNDNQEKAEEVVDDGDDENDNEEMEGNKA
jgi:hypothetical protein